MISAPDLRGCAAAFLLFACLTATVGAQHVLMAEDGGKMSMVCAADGLRPCVQRNGKVVEINTKGYVLQDVPEYLPVFVTVRDIASRTTSEQINNAGQANNNFYFNATVESSYPLSDVFLVLDLQTESNGRIIFLSEVGTLEPNRSRPISVYVPMAEPLGSGQYQLHLFSGGAEVFQSTIPFWSREQTLNKMVARRIKDVHAAPPKLFVGTPPEYPAALRKSGAKGMAVISVRIGANGDVFDPVVKSATDPAFGEAALTAIRDWRFLPKVKDDLPVETKADVPFIFSPPGAGGAHS